MKLVIKQEPFEYADDVKRIVGVCLLNEYEIDFNDAKTVWKNYSQSVCAEWLTLPEDDDALLEIVLKEAIWGGSNGNMVNLPIPNDPEPDYEARMKAITEEKAKYKPSYSSGPDTRKHSNRVMDLMQFIISKLSDRSCMHDDSKFHHPEKLYFDQYTPILRTLKYGSEEYKQSIESLKPALEHHYKNNPHHPEFYANGIDGMNLIDIIEMFCDWIAAGERTKGGTFENSLKVSSEKFKMSEQLVNIFRNTYSTMQDK